MAMRDLLETLELQGNTPDPLDRLLQRMSRGEGEVKHLPTILVPSLAPDERRFIEGLPRLAQADLWDVPQPSLHRLFTGRGARPRWFVGELDGDVTVLVHTADGGDRVQHVARLLSLDH